MIGRPRRHGGASRAGPARGLVITILTEGLFGRLAFGMVSFALPLYALALGLDLATIGYVVALRSLVVIPAKPLAGWLADRLGLRAVYMLSGALRVAAAVGLLFAVDAAGLLVVRALQGLSAAGRDVASLGVIARDAEGHVGSVFGWYTTAKHVGGVAGAAAAGFMLAASGGDFQAVFVAVTVMSAVPLLAAWRGVAADPQLEPASRPASADAGPDSRASGAAHDSRASDAAPGEARQVSLPGAALVAGLVAAAAYMLHGLFPVLATEYAGLSAAEAGLIYSLSAAVLLVCGPLFGWLTDRFGTWTGLGWRPLANIGSSLLYLLPPSFASVGVARAVDDSGKAAFRPAWASLAVSIAGDDPRRRSQRLGTLDTAQSIGEAAGPALAGLLWQTGGIVALFAVRIVLAVAGEMVALRVLGGWREVRVRAGTLLSGSLCPVLAALLPAFAGIAAAAGIVSTTTAAAGQTNDPGPLALAGSVAVAGCLVGMLTGWKAAAQREQVRQEAVAEYLAGIRHDVREPLAVIRGELELVLSREDVPLALRATSVESAVGAVERIVETVAGYPEGTVRQDGTLSREGHPERGAFPGPVVHAGGAAMGLRDGADDGEPESGARVRA